MSKDNLILAIDDDTSILDFIELGLSGKTKYKMHRATTVDKGIELINSNKYRVIILDILMGKKETSHGLIHYIREHESGPNYSTPLIVISAWMENDYAERIKAKCESIEYTIKKPLKLNEIVNFIERADRLMEGEVESITILHGSDTSDETSRLVKGKKEILGEERHFVHGQREDLDGGRKRISGGDAKDRNENILVEGRGQNNPVKEELFEYDEDYDFSDLENMATDEKTKQDDEELLVKENFEKKISLKKTSLTLGGKGIYGSKLSFNKKDLITSDRKVMKDKPKKNQQKKKTG